MKISTIVPAYNCQPYLRRAVESLLATQYPDLEVVIIDDGSSDGTYDLALELQREHPHAVCVRTHPRRVNRGVSASRNLGLEQSTGELLAFLDADDIAHPWRFESAVEQLQSSPEIDAVHQVCELDLSEETSEFWRAGNLRFGFQSPVAPDEILFELLKGFCWATSAVLFRRRLLAETGLFDPRLRTCEDCHFWMRLACCGTVASGDLSRPVSVYWRRADSAYQPSPWQRLQMIRAMSYFYSWMKRWNPSDERLPKVAAAISRYLLNGVEVARLNGARQLAWNLATRGAAYFPRVCRERRYFENLARLSLGR